MSEATKMKPVFATLTPANVLAKMAFSDVFDAVTRSRQTAPPDAAARCMNVEAEQEYHRDVCHFRREMERNSAGDSSQSGSLTEPDTETESKMKELGMIWKGHYFLGFENVPVTPPLGWVAGKRAIERESSADLILCTGIFDRRHRLNFRSSHIRFNFDLQNGAFFIASITKSPSAGTAVNGEAISRQMHTLNQHSMKIWVNSLEYDFRYTHFASTEDFKNERRNYLFRYGDAPPSVDFEMPTPQRTTRTIGQWTLSIPLGKGSAGRVFLASNSKNELVAIKIMERTSGSALAVDKEVAMGRQLTALAQKQDDGGRLVRLKELIDTGGETSSSTANFHEVALVLEPMTPKTLADLMGNESTGEWKGMSMQSAAIFRDAMLGIRFLHENGWLHRDIKPQNIGVLLNPPRAVILDLGQAKALSLGSTLPATPGHSGTVNYLAPEREMIAYDHAVDLWPMGVIAFELTYGHHPFQFAANPWRPGEKYEKMRPAFHQRYQQAIHRLSTDYRQYSDQKAANREFIHFGDMLVQMLRYEWAENSQNRARRIDVNEALQHPAWGSLSFDGRQAKRARLESSDGGAD